MKRSSRSCKAHKRNIFIKREHTLLVNLLRPYEPGDKVLIRIDPSIHKGQPCPRVANRVGLVQNKLNKMLNGNYSVKIQNKTYIVNSAHLRPYHG